MVNSQRILNWLTLALSTSVLSGGVGFAVLAASPTILAIALGASTGILGIGLTANNFNSLFLEGEDLSEEELLLILDQLEEILLALMDAIEQMND